MRRQKNQPDDALRRRSKITAAADPPALCEMSHGDVIELVHELRVHQIELETQNDELRRVQLELSESRDRYWDLYDAAPVSYLTLSPTGKILKANLTASVLLDVERSNLIGQSFYGLLSNEDSVSLQRGLRSLTQNRDRATCDLRISDTRGGVIDVHAQCVYTAGVEGQDHTLRIALTDVTALKTAERQRLERLELEQKLQQKQRLASLGVLAGGIAHDFNNLLVVIVGHADLLQETGPTASQLVSIQQIQTAATRSAELCGQMLAYSGKGNFEKSVFDLAATVRGMGDLLASSVRKANISLRYESATDLPGVEGDVTAIRQIVMNLILNAAEAIGTDDGTISVMTGRVTVSQEYLPRTHLDDDLQSGDYVFLDVVDTGCGIDDESIEKIFDPFFTTKFTGRGLGLASVQGIVRSHHGAIKIESRLGYGTTVRVLLPASDKPTTTPDRLPFRRELPADQQTVLLVDDEEMVRFAMQSLLEARGYTVLCAADGHGAISVLRDHMSEVAIVLLDLTMPGQSAAATCKCLHAMVPDLPVILMSGFSEADALRQCDYSNIAGFVPKPIGDIVSAVGQVLKSTSVPESLSRWETTRRRS
jgi:two-component system, cell cycle sensor histidine kinase and response regulator CckA